MNYAPLRGQLSTVDAVREYAAAGKATLTIVSKGTGARFTFKFQRPPEVVGQKRPIWVKVLTGADNEAAYTFLGTIWENDGVLVYRHAPKSKIGFHAPSARALDWLVRALADPSKFEQCEVWHEGTCGRCGRKLTVPTSIASGFGPECITMI